MTPQFIHLNVHTEYSIKDGICRIEPLLEKAVAFNMPAIAVNDQNNLFAMVKFYSNAIESGIKPIFGAMLLISDDTTNAPKFNMIALCQNNIGFSNLKKIISKSYIEGQVTGTPVVKKQWLYELNEGLIMLSGAKEGEIFPLLVQDNMAEAKAILQQWKNHFSDRFYLELQRIGDAEEKTYIDKAIVLAHETQTPVVATHPVRFIESDDFEAHEARVCIHHGEILSNIKRIRRHQQSQYLRTPNEMVELFKDIPSAIQNTVEIAKRCNVTLTLGKTFLPAFPTPDNKTESLYLKEQAFLGLEGRLHKLYPDTAAREAKREEYETRLNIELDVINAMGFAGYFLIVADFIQWSKDQNIPVGPGRGSGAGSLVAYSLKITDLDPLQYDLLFERFLNPERVSLPDFDIDFCMDRRDEVIEYVANRYGKESVAQIITFGTMAARAVVRDVGRVLGHPYGFVDKIAKLVPFEIGITLEKALKDEKNLAQLYEQEDEVRELIDLAQKLEGIVRNAGKHAGGVVIAPGKLTDFSALYCEKDATQYVTQLDKDDVETIGLVKFDFLGLRTLTIIHHACEAIQARYPEQIIDINHIPLNCAKTFKLFKSCETTAVFQLESRGMKDLLKRLQPDCFEEIVALVALFRPGPLQSGMVDDFINRKHGRQALSYLHPIIEPILKTTYGVILYQEQVMQIAQVLSGYTLGSADILRRAMGKKKPEEMEEQRSIFTQGAVTLGVSLHIAEQIFDVVEKFAGYGFNKSHSAAYALIAYQTAWLKAHYPAEFMAAVMSADMDNTDKVVHLISECHDMKLAVVSPNVNRSHYAFVVVDDKIVYGLGAIKGVGFGAIQCVVDARAKDGEFQNLFDFCARLDLKKVNRRVLEAFIRAGAFDEIESNRARLFYSIDAAIQFAEQKNKNQNAGQGDLFAEETSMSMPEMLADVPTWSDKIRLQGEKETLGLYLTGHPLQNYQQELKHFVSTKITQLHPDTRPVSIAGLLVGVRMVKTKTGKRLGIVTLEDQSGRIDVTLFSAEYDKYRDLLIEDALLIVEGVVAHDDFSGGLRMRGQQVMTLSQARARHVKSLSLKAGTVHGEDFMDKLAAILQPFCPGQCPVFLEYQQGNNKVALQLGQEWRVKPDDQLILGLREWLGEEQVKWEFK